jgi:transposase InsO family protein
MDRRGHGTVTRSAVYRVLVRNGLIEPKSRKRRRQDYKRRERPVAMQLWQLDVTASAFLADGREVNIVTGIDDHSRYCVIAKAVLRATARPVCQAFLDAMAIYGTVFTGRFIKPRPAVVLFERICRENGITRRLTRPASPTTTGKIERLHQSLQNELLNDHGPLESIGPGARSTTLTGRHQFLDMAFPASRFGPAASNLELRVPTHQELSSPQALDHTSAAPAAGRAEPSLIAVEADRRVPPSGNLWVGGQQIWLGPALAGRTVTIWVDETSLHVLLHSTPAQDPAISPRLD